MNNCFPNFPRKLPEDIRAWAKEMRTRMTDAEALLWRLLRDRRLADAKFRRQHPVGRYILDFYCAERKICVELDGGQHSEMREYDKHREICLGKQGIRVLRFWNNQVLMESESVLEVIYEALLVEVPSRLRSHQRPSPPTPLPRAGEGSDFSDHPPTAKC